jgi:hypothetical protein
LTGTGSQINVDDAVSIKMSFKNLTHQQAPRLPPWQILTCVFLAGLFLYNPFLSARQSFGSVVVCHPASHRATVGSSELEQFTQPTGNMEALLPEIDAVQVLILQIVARNSESRRYAREIVIRIPQTGLSSSLWFRPPPVV